MSPLALAGQAACGSIALSYIVDVISRTGQVYKPRLISNRFLYIFNNSLQCDYQCTSYVTSLWKTFDIYTFHIFLVFTKTKKYASVNHSIKSSKPCHTLIISFLVTDLHVLPVECYLLDVKQTWEIFGDGATTSKFPICQISGVIKENITHLCMLYVEYS
jgi:hypothetical protein